MVMMRASVDLPQPDFAHDRERPAALDLQVDALERVHRARAAEHAAGDDSRG